MNRARLRRILMFVAIASSWAQCTRDDQNREALVRQTLETLEGELVPDRRLAVFEIDWALQDGRLTVFGKVDRSEVRDQILGALADNTGLTPVDRIVLLPHPDLGDAVHGIVQVSVANLRREPKHSAELVSQLLLGTGLRLLEKEEGWFRVQGPDGYLGWLEEEAFLRMNRSPFEAWQASSKVLVTALHSSVHAAAETEAPVVSDLVIGCELQGSVSAGRWSEVRLPDGTAGWVPSDGLADLADWERGRRPDPRQIEQTARRFLGAPYLWGGSSANGLDCSGFTKTVFHLNGLQLLRDSSQQARQGDPIEPGTDFENLRKGDLLFFGRPAGVDSPERVSHVALYLGGLEFIHAAPGPVRIGSLDPAAANYDEFNRGRFLGARRVVLPSAQPRAAR